MNFPELPSPPFVAAIFPNQRSAGDDEAYSAMADRMVELASLQAGYLGLNSTRDENGFGITISYWQDEQSAKNWRAVAEHQVAQKLGRERWYQQFQLQICTVTSHVDFKADDFARSGD